MGEIVRQHFDYSSAESIAQRTFWNLKCLRSFHRCIYHLGNVGPVVGAKDSGNDAGWSNVILAVNTVWYMWHYRSRLRACPRGTQQTDLSEIQTSLACSVTYFWFHGCAVGHRRRPLHQTRPACFCGNGSLAIVIELNCDFCSILLALKSDAFETTGQWLRCISCVLLLFLGPWPAELHLFKAVSHDPLR